MKFTSKNVAPREGIAGEVSAMRHPPGKGDERYQSSGSPIACGL